MIPSLLLTTLSTFATPVFISDVRATREAGHLRIEVRGDGGIDPETARTRMDEGRLILFLEGARVRADNRAWSLEDGVGEIRAHRHHSETELEIPLTGNGCTGPVELQGTPTGMTALVGCDGAAPTGARRAAADRRGATAARAASAAPGSRSGQVTGTSADEVRDPRLEALVALPAGEPTPSMVRAAAAQVNAPKAVKNAPATTAVTSTTAAKATAKAAEPTTSVPSAPSARPAVAKAEAPAVATAALPATPLVLPPPATEVPEASDKTESTAPTRLRAVSLPAILLAGLAVAAFLFARRRRQPKLRQIEILETASLGPKRSLVVARVGEETLVLGTSEAGITLLKSSGGPAGEAIAAMMLPSVVTPAVTPAPTGASVPTTPPASTAAAPAPTRSTRETLAFAPIAAPVERERSPSAAERAALAHADEMAQPLIEALADVPEPDHVAEPVVKGATFRSIEGGLASLFGRGGAASSASNGRATSARFDDILEDSIEDQELRRKLAAGMSARIR